MPRLHSAPYSAVGATRIRTCRHTVEVWENNQSLLLGISAAPQDEPTLEPVATTYTPKVVNVGQVAVRCCIPKTLGHDWLHLFPQMPQKDFCQGPAALSRPGRLAGLNLSGLRSALARHTDLSAERRRHFKHLESSSLLRQCRGFRVAASPRAFQSRHADLPREYETCW